MSTLPKELPERFRQKIRVAENGCWVWTAALFRTGYGAYRLAGRTCYAHRIAFEQCVGLIPEGYEIDHLCSNKACVNPAHLEAVTPYVNKERSQAWVRNRKTHCPAGHPYEHFAFTDSAGYRRCWVCRRETANEYARRKRAKQKNPS